MAVVLGGGLSGLSAAYYLKKSGQMYQNKLYIIEALKRCGGWIQTSQGDDYVFEIGPRTIRTATESGKNTLKLVEDLGLTNLIIPITQQHPSAKNRMVYVKGELHTLPASFSSLFRINKPFTKAPIMALVHDMLADAPAANVSDESIYDFTSRRFGEEVAKYAISPLICGICAGDAREISVKFLMKTLFEYEQKYGGVVKGALRSLFKTKPQSGQIESNLIRKATFEKWTSYTFKGGLQVLPNALLNSVLDDNCHLYSDVRPVKLKFYIFKGDKKAYIKFSNGIEFVTNSLLSSLPAFELGCLVEDDHPYLAQLLHEISFVTVAVVNLKYNTSDLLPRQAFGFLVPPAENLPILGVIFDSCCFPNENNGTVLTVMMGGKWFDERCGKNTSKSEILELAKKHISDILGIKISPETSKVSILRNCIAQYTIGHYERVQKIKDYIEEKNLPLSAFGASFDGVGVNDVILSARRAVENSINK